MGSGAADWGASDVGRSVPGRWVDLNQGRPPDPNWPASGYDDKGHFVAYCQAWRSDWVWVPDVNGGVNWTHLDADRSIPVFTSQYGKVYHNYRRGATIDVGSDLTVTTGPRGTSITTPYPFGPYSITTSEGGSSLSLQIGNATASFHLPSGSFEFGISQANYGFFSESSWEIQPTWEGTVVLGALLITRGVILPYLMGQQFLQPGGLPAGGW